ncbi:MAG: YeeE/YedE family protein, partial [Rhizobiaceae bacterium]
MENLAAWLVEAGPSAIAWGGLIIGAVFGFTVQRSNFCTMGSLNDIHVFGDTKRFRTWMLSIAVAIAATLVLGRMGAFDIGRSMYLTASVPLGGAIVGGLLFGIGMVFGGGCATRNLVRVGAGDVRSLMVLLVMGLFAYMTIGGILGPLRVALLDPLTIDLSERAATQGLGDLLAAATGMEPGTALTVAASLVVVAILAYCFADAGFRKAWGAIAAAVIFGLCVAAGWVLTG